MNFKRLMAVLGVALVGMCASPAQAEGGNFEYTLDAGCNEETGVLDYMITDIANNTSEALEVLITLDLNQTDELPGETVVSQLLNPGDTMPDVIRPFPFGGLVELFTVDPTGVEEPTQLATAYYSIFHSCTDTTTSEPESVVLPATGTNQPKWPILLLIGVGSALLLASRRPRTATEITELH